MIQQTIDELRALYDALTENHMCNDSDLFAIQKAIIACEQLRRYKKKAKRWKRKYLTLVADYDEYCKESWKGGAE